MPRPLRPIAAGLVYHVINRGNNRQPVFHDEADYLAFLRMIAQIQERKPFDLLGYCLMPNHIHLLIQARTDPVSRIVQSVLVSHTHRYHRVYQATGHVWQGRFKSPVVQDDDHLLAVLRYIEANPIRAGLVQNAADYRWSSYGYHSDGRADAVLAPSSPYEALGVNPIARRRHWQAMVHELPNETELAAIRRSNEMGLPYGDPGWVERLGRRLKLDLVIRPRGRPRKTAVPPAGES